MSAITLAEQIRCVQREIAMRRSVYPRLIQSGKMKQGTADREIAAMEAVVQTLTRAETAARWSETEMPRGNVPAAAVQSDRPPPPSKND